MKYLRCLKNFFGIATSRSTSAIFLSQQTYVMNLLKETSMTISKTIIFLIERELKLCIKKYQTSTNKEICQRFVWRLTYLSHTKPYLSYDFSLISQFRDTLDEKYMDIVIQILRYIKVNSEKGVLFKKNSKMIYIDAN